METILVQRPCVRAWAVTKNEHRPLSVMHSDAAAAGLQRYVSSAFYTENGVSKSTDG